jgi:hypothetical protein
MKLNNKLLIQFSLIMPLKNTSITIFRKYLRSKLPIELVWYILEFVYQPLRKELLLSIKRNFGTKSVWWKPSGRLLELCRDNGTIQINYYDEWSIFQQYFLYRKLYWERYSHYSHWYYPEDELSKPYEEFLNDDWQIYRCGVSGICANCVAYRFPCSTAATKNNNSYSHIWNIQDEPSCRDIVNQLVHNGVIR